MPMISKKVLSDMLMLSVSTIDRLIAAGMPKIKIGKSVRFYYEDVEKWIKERDEESKDA